jgi:hypothetical protein
MVKIQPFNSCGWVGGLMKAGKQQMPDKKFQTKYME